MLDFFRRSSGLLLPQGFAGCAWKGGWKWCCPDSSECPPCAEYPDEYEVVISGITGSGSTELNGTFLPAFLPSGETWGDWFVSGDYCYYQWNISRDSSIYSGDTQRVHVYIFWWASGLDAGRRRIFVRTMYDIPIHGLVDYELNEPGAGAKYACPDIDGLDIPYLTNSGPPNGSASTCTLSAVPP